MVVAACAAQFAVVPAGPSQLESSTTSPTEGRVASGIATPETTASAARDHNDRFVADFDPFMAPPGGDVPLAVDPRLHTGILDNGVRWMIQPNGAPGSQAQLRLVVAAGSVDEPDGSLGAAHFVEHMMFNGTTAYPGNDLITVLEGFGSGFGADINAYTGYVETVYQLTVPIRQEGDAQPGFDILREWATEATIDGEAVVAERGVVREEYRRQSETASGRIGLEILDAVLGDTAYANRPPIGRLHDIDSMEAVELTDFYRRWYRPEAMTIIAVGDLGLEDTRARIEATFGDIEASGPPPVRGERASDGPLPEPVFDVVTDPEITSTDISIAWRSGATSVTSPSSLRDDLITRLAYSLLDTRLFRSVRRGETSLTSAGVRLSAPSPDHVGFEVAGGGHPATVVSEVAHLLALVEQVRQHRVGDDEFEAAVAELVGGAERRLAGADTAQDRAIAAAAVSWSLGGPTPLHPELGRDSTLEALALIEPVDVQRFVDQLISSPPYVLVTAPASAADDLPGPQLLAETVDSILGWKVEAPLPQPTLPDELMERPAAAAVEATVEIPELKTTLVTYANGARMAFRPSTIVDDQVEFNAWSRGGFFQEDGPVVPLLGRISSLVMSSGFESTDAVGVDALLSDAVVSLNGEIRRAEETLNGEASVDDLETLFQLIHLQMTEPTIEDLAVRRFVDAWLPLAKDPDSGPELAADLALWRLRYGDSPWHRLAPTVQDLETFDREAQLAAWKRRFDNAADFIFVFVGDVELDQLVDLGSRYLGTLPASSEREQPIDRDPGIPEQNLSETVAVGVGDQARLRINWESGYPMTLRTEIAAEALEVVVNARLRDVIREQLGASYAPRAQVVLLTEPKMWVDTIIEIDTDPGRIDEVAATVRAELGRVRSGDIEVRYLDAAVAQMVEDYRFFSNPEWLELIRRHLVNAERPAGEHRARADAARSLTIFDLADAATVIFPAGRSVEVRMIPG